VAQAGPLRLENTIKQLLDWLCCVSAAGWSAELLTIVTQHGTIKVGGRGGSGVPTSRNKAAQSPRSTAGLAYDRTAAMLHADALTHHVGRDTARTATLERAALFTATRPADFCRARAMVLLRELCKERRHWRDVNKCP
jgi:hypothetical protein